MTHKKLFQEVPVGTSVLTEWAVQPTALLDSAAEKIRAHGAEPWVFIGDPRVFAQFAGDAERAALTSLTAEEHLALLGEWSDEDWREALGFSYSMTSKEGA